MRNAYLKSMLVNEQDSVFCFYRFQMISCGLPQTLISLDVAYTYVGIARKGEEIYPEVNRLIINT